MVTAIVLLNVERGRIAGVAEELVELKGVSEVHSVAGRYDIAAIIRTRTNDQLAELVSRDMLQVEGITASETLFAFRVYSSKDLAAAFALGFDD